MAETPQSIPNSFESFLNVGEKEKKEETLAEKFAKERLEWSSKIEGMSKKMKDIYKVSELQTEVYTERQRALEYYHYLISILSRVNRKYRKEYTTKYDFYSFQSQKRFPNERNKELQIQHEVGDILEKREAIDNHAKFINNTIATIDNLIYGIKYKVEIEQISRGK